MALQDEYIEALNNCIDRLASGENIEAILHDYPAMANELRPMLEVGNLFPRVRIPAAEVSAIQSRLAPKVQAAALKGAGSINAWALPAVIVFLALGFFVIWIVKQQSPVTNDVGAEITAEATAESSPDATSEVTAEATEAPLITIEGAVEAINANVITIYGIEIVLAADDPILAVIQIGDVLRIEGEYQAEIFVAIVIVFVDAEVSVQNGEVWRDTGNCDNPPPPWAPANGWRRRCEGGGGNGNGRGNGRGGS